MGEAALDHRAVDPAENDAAAGVGRAIWVAPLVVGLAIGDQDLGERVGDAGEAVGFDPGVAVAVGDDTGELDVMVAGGAVVAADDKSAFTETAGLDLVEAKVVEFHVPREVIVKDQTGAVAGGGTVVRDAGAG